MNIQIFLKTVRKFVRLNYPGYKAETVTVRFKGGGAVRLSVLGKTPACQLAGASERLAENEMQVLGVMPDNEKPGLTSEKIAKAAGYKHNSYLLTILRSLRKKGLVDLKPDGYKKVK